MTVHCSHPNQSCAGNDKHLIRAKFITSSTYWCFLSVEDLFQVVRVMEGNLFWHWSEFFLDQTGEINLHMVFPQYQILFKCLFKTSNGGACWERWNTSMTPTNAGSLVYQNTVWSVKCQVCYKASRHNLAPWNSTLNPEPPTPMFNSDLCGAQELWRLILVLLSVMQMAARPQSARFDFTANTP